ncbi:MAG: ribosomal protein S18-alanine N-acetyltransferase [Myxococcota bacterium]
MSARALQIRVRRMTPEDVPAVLEIENASFPRPWKAHQFHEEFKRDVSRLYVAERTSEGAGQLVGYLSAWCVAGEMHILNVACSPRVRRRGVARQLILQAAALAAREDGCTQVFLEVRRSNDGAQALYLTLGFTACGVRPRYYSEENEDAILMRADIAEDGTLHPPPP